MVLITEENLKIMDSRTLALARKYLKQGCLKRIVVNEIEKNAIYKVEGTIQVSAYENICHFFINVPLHSVYSTHCDCPWYFDDKHICAHIGMLMIYLTKVDIQNFPYASQKESSPASLYNEDYLARRKRIEEELKRIQMEESYQRTRDLILQQKENQDYLVQLELQTQQYDVVPVVSYLDFDAFLLSFTVGAQKQYTIKNIPDFLHWIDTEQYHSYGKQLGFIHTKNAFTPQSQKYIDFMRMAYSVPDYDRYYYRYNNTRYIRIHTLLPAFYTTFKDDVHVPIREEDFVLPIHIEKEEKHYTISLVWDQEEHILTGDHQMFALRDRPFEIIHYTVCPQSSIITLFRAVSENPLHIPFDEYQDFERYLINPAKEYLKITKGQDLLPVSNSLSIHHPIVYGDMDENETVSFHVTGKDEQANTVELLYNDQISYDWTIELIQKLLESYATWIDKDAHTIYMGLEDERTFDFLQQGITQLQKYCDVYISDALKKLGKRTKYNLQTGIRIDNGLLEIQLESTDFDVNEVPAILQAYHRKKRYFKLKNGQLLHLESDQFQELDELMQDFDIHEDEIRDGKLQLELYRTLGMNERLNHAQALQVYKEDSLTDYIQGFEQRKSKISCDPHYASILRDYQKRGVEWLLMLYQYNLNGILADEMGLGKTLQVIALLDSIQDPDKHTLIVCPASLIYNWEDEIHRFSESLSCLSITGTKEERKKRLHDSSKHDILITSYDYLRRDIDEYQDLTFEYVVLDEAQNIKNQKTKNATSVKKLHARHRLALSGTPIENSLAELWSIFDFLMPGYLFSYPYFKTQFESPIVLNQNEDSIQKLRSFVSPFILRRTKKEVLKELPDKVDHQYLIDFSKEEEKLYLANLTQASKEMQVKMKEPHIDHIAVLAALTKLRQLCCDPRLLYDNIQKPSSKVQACMELVQILTEHNKKVLLFSSFTSLIDLLTQELEQNQISYYILTGSTSKEERRQLVHAFQTDTTQVFLISLKAGGTGLNLTAAEAVIHIDPWWNLSAQNQATDRAHRIGQNANVQVYRLIMKNSIEEKIVKMQERKKNLADTFIEGNDGSLSKMSKDEILSLFQRD